VRVDACLWFVVRTVLMTKVTVNELRRRVVGLKAVRVLAVVALVVYVILVSALSGR
jgi:hypothetical protein